MTPEHRAMLIYGAWNGYLGRLDDAQWVQENAEHMECYVMDRTYNMLRTLIERI
jgi:hypothetical protein